jgi:hypothetical protein
VRKSRLLIALGFSTALGSSSVAAIDIKVNPSAQDVDLGHQVNVTLVISGLTDLAPPALGSFDLDVLFDPAILSFGSASYGDPALGDQLDPTGLAGVVTSTTPGVGSVNLFGLSLEDAISLNALQAGQFTLGTLIFNAIGAGSSPLGLRLNDLSDAGGAALTADASGGTVRVQGPVAVAEPLTVLLVGSGLVGRQVSAVLRRRLKRIRFTQGQDMS